MHQIAQTKASLPSSFDDFMGDHRRKVVRDTFFLSTMFFTALTAFDYYYYPSLFADLVLIRAAVVALSLIIFLLLIKNRATFISMIAALVIFDTLGVLSTYALISDPYCPYPILLMFTLGSLGFVPYNNFKMHSISLIFVTTSYFLTHTFVLNLSPLDPLPLFILLNCLFVSGFAFDLSKRSSSMLLKNYDLREELWKQSDAIFKHNTQLEQLDSAKTKLLSTISHEFRTPITVILVAISNLKNSKHELSKDVTNLLDIGEYESLRLLRLANNMLDSFYALESETNTNKTLNPVNISQIIRHQLKTFMLLSDRKNLMFTLDCEASDTLILSTPSDIQKIVSNVVINAIKYTDSGSISIICRDLPERYVLIVKDTGPGIPSNYTEQIFQPFKMVQSSLNKGAGLGLPLVRSLLNEIGGTIEYDDNTPRGSIFTISIPAHSASSEPSETLSTIDDLFSHLNNLSLTYTSPPTLEIAPSLSNKAHTILVIDDEPNILQTITASLKNHYNVFPASRESQALSILENQRIDAIVIDYVLDETTGLKLAKKIKQRLPDKPVLMLTANQDPKLKSTYDQNIIDGFILKPFDPALLITTINRLIRN